MATRKIKDAKDLSTQELIYFKGHAKATFMSDGATVEDSVRAVSDEVGKKADAAGTYLEFTAGRSIDMLGVHEGSDSEFLFRPTDGEGSIKDGEAVVERIEGNSVVWNQLLKNDLDTLVLNGVTFTNNGDGTFLVNGTATANIWYPCINAPFSVSKNHKYLLYGCPKGGSSDTYCLYEYNGYLTNDIGNGSITQVNGDSLRPFIVIGSGFTANNLVFKPRVVDLTKMFGAGYEPLTLEEFYQRIPIGVDLNAYNEGEVVNMNVEGIKSVGFNAWDEEWEMGYIDASNGNTIYALNHICAKNKIHILPNTTYYFAKPAGVYTIIAYYDMDGLYIGQQDPFATSGMGGTFKTFENAHYMKFYCDISEYNNDICINLVHTGYRNGEYEPYVSDEIALPIADYFPNGMCSIGSVCDEITQMQTIQRIAVREFQEGDFENSKVLTDGTKTYYKLAEPIVTDIEPILLSYEAWDFGTEQALAEQPTAPIKASIVYGFNARDTIRNNRNSIEELTRRITILEQMLGAMAAQAQAVNFVE